MNDKIYKELNRIKIEDYIWIIYIFLVCFNLYSDYLEKLFLTTNDQVAKNKFRNINKSVSVIILIIFIYFLIVSYQDVKELNNNSSLLEKKLKNLTFIASILFVIAGAISLYVTFKSPDLDSGVPVI